WTPVDRHKGFVGQAMMVHLQEDPLRPAVVIGIGGIDLARPVIHRPDLVELTAERADILVRAHARMDAFFDGVIFGRQSKRVPSHGALYSPVTSYSGSRRLRGHSRANAPRAALTPRDRETYPDNSIWAVDPHQRPYASHALPIVAATSVRSLALYKARCSSIPY